ncbi:MAG: elongation factor P 5-aminopentanone reductase [Bacillota bacterium]|jgi:3-oxoacyl-[acyl-carrier protein] reductase
MQRQTVLITGAARGIGRAIAVLFAKNGYNVAINYNQSRTQAKELVAELQAAGIEKDRLYLIRADISRTEEVSHMIARTIKCFGQIDILINNAGISYTGLLTDMTEQEWDDIFNTNIKAMFSACRLVLPQMVSRKNGKIINISSMWGQVGASCEVAYSASKGAVDAFTKALAQEMGPSGITVNAVSPGVIATDINSHLSENEMTDLKNETPLEKIGRPEDVAEAALFLASEKADFITGQIIPVNGGFITA